MGKNCPRSSAKGRTSRPVNNMYLTSSRSGASSCHETWPGNKIPFPKDLYDLTEVANRKVVQKRKSGSVEKATKRCH